MTRRTYYAPAESTAEPAADDDRDIRHGYTLDNIDRLARGAIDMAFARAGDIIDRYQTAWSAIVEHIYTTTSPPTESRLRYVGAVAIDRWRRDERHHHGINDHHQTSHRYAQYWDTRDTPSMADRIIDRHALRQIWAVLPEAHRNILTHLAAHDGDNRATADALGTTTGAVAVRLSKARAAVRGWWHEGETPPRMWGRGNHRRGNRSATQLLRARRHVRAYRARAVPALLGAGWDRQVRHRGQPVLIEVPAGEFGDQRGSGGALDLGGLAEPAP